MIICGIGECSTKSSPALLESIWGRGSGILVQEAKTQSTDLKKGFYEGWAILIFLAKENKRFYHEPTLIPSTSMQGMWMFGSHQGSFWIISNDHADHGDH